MALDEPALFESDEAVAQNAFRLAGQEARRRELGSAQAGRLGKAEPPDALLRKAAFTRRRANASSTASGSRSRVLTRFRIISRPRVGGISPELAARYPLAMISPPARNLSEQHVRQRRKSAVDGRRAASRHPPGGRRDRVTSPTVIMSHFQRPRIDAGTRPRHRPCARRPCGRLVDLVEKARARRPQRQSGSRARRLPISVDRQLSTTASSKWSASDALFATSRKPRQQGFRRFEAAVERSRFSRIAQGRPCYDAFLARPFGNKEGDAAWIKSGWKSYPPGVPAEIDPTRYSSVAELLEEAFLRAPQQAGVRLHGKGHQLRQLDALSRKLAAWFQSKGACARCPHRNHDAERCCNIRSRLRRFRGAGYVVVNVNPLYTPRSAEHQLKDSGAEDPNPGGLLFSPASSTMSTTNTEPDTDTKAPHTMYAVLEPTTDLTATTSIWVDARCRDGAGTLTHLFFSDELLDIARAKAICARCTLRRVPRWGPRARRAVGVWGGELIRARQLVVNKRPRGRPPKHFVRSSWSTRTAGDRAGPRRRPRCTTVAASSTATPASSSASRSPGPTRPSGDRSGRSHGQSPVRGNAQATLGLIHDHHRRRAVRTPANGAAPVVRRPGDGGSASCTAEWWP